MINYYYKKVRQIKVDIIIQVPVMSILTKNNN